MLIGAWYAMVGLPAAVLAELTLAEQRARDRDRAEAAVRVAIFSFVAELCSWAFLQRMAAATALEDQLLAMERSPLDVLVELGGSGSSGSGAGDAKAGTVSPQHQARPSASTAVCSRACAE